MHFSCVYIFVSMQNSTRREFEIQPENLLIRENYHIMARQTVFHSDGNYYMLSVFLAVIYGHKYHTSFKVIAYISSPYDSP